MNTPKSGYPESADTSPGLLLPDDVINSLKSAMYWSFAKNRLTKKQQEYHSIVARDAGCRHDMVLAYMAGDRGVSLTDATFENTKRMGWFLTQGGILAQSDLVEIRGDRAYITTEGIAFVRALGKFD